MCKVISLEEFKNRDRPLEFSWSFEPTKFYAIHLHDVNRIMYLLSLDSTYSATFRYRKF